MSELLEFVLLLMQMTRIPLPVHLELRYTIRQTLYCNEPSMTK
jgi:hypothetical protein